VGVTELGRYVYDKKSSIFYLLFGVVLPLLLIFVSYNVDILFCVAMLFVK